MAKFREDMYMKQALELETLRERLTAENKRKQVSYFQKFGISVSISLVYTN